ncbi:hypothetical protein B0H13DRAFT_2674783 [Mycena leptocephala]|nr:hypothetical protein B0H13DRAFT_2674783 [Mycena leptocephala]
MRRTRMVAKNFSSGIRGSRTSSAGGISPVLVASRFFSTFSLANIASSNTLSTLARLQICRFWVWGSEAHYLVRRLFV